jgi:hypothetical protein
VTRVRSGVGRSLRAVRRRIGGGANTGTASTVGTVFIGGTGRSGTTITSAMLGRHPALTRINTEVKFISNTGGLCDLVNRKTSADAFEQRLKERWFDRGEAKGLKTLFDWPTIEAALSPLRKGLRDDRAAAAAAFTRRLLDPLATAQGTTAWIEMTPNAALTADTLVRMFPDLRMLHLVRDGRDVACSVVRMPWGPNDPDEGLDWWGRRLERAFDACAALPAGQVLTIRLEDLVVRDREATYGRILAFLGLDDDPVMRTFFEELMPADKMHLGRWRSDVPEADHEAFEAHYRRIAEGLAERGHPYRADAASASA